MELDAYLAACMSAWKDTRRESVIAAVRQGAERHAVARTAVRFRRHVRDSYKAVHAKPLISHMKAVLREIDVKYLDEITREKVESWIKSSQRKGVPVWTIKGRRRALKALTSWAIENRLLADNPMAGVRSPKVVSDPDALDPEQVPLVLRAAEGHPGEVAVALALLAGLRRREISALEWVHVDFKRSTLTLPSTVVKANTKSRQIPMHPRLVKILSKRQLEAGDLRPAGGAHPDTLGDWAGEILEKAEVRKAGPRRALQVLRRTWVSVLRHRGVDAETVTAWAGHSMEVEERYYRRAYAPENPELIKRIRVV